MEQLDGDGKFGSGLEGEPVLGSGGSGGAEWHGVASDLLCEEHRGSGGGREHGDGDVQWGGSLSGHSDCGIQWVGPGESAGCVGGSAGDDGDEQQRIGDDGQCQRSTGWSERGADHQHGSGNGLHEPRDYRGRGHFGRSSGDGNGELQCHGGFEHHTAVDHADGGVPRCRCGRDGAKHHESESHVGAGGGFGNDHRDELWEPARDKHSHV